MATDYSKKTNAELIEILKSRSLPYTGKKVDLIARLRSDDAKAKTTPSVAAGAKADTADDVIDWGDDAPVAEEPVESSPEADDTAIAAGGSERVANPVVVPNQTLEIEPATTDDLKVEGADPEAAVVTASKSTAGVSTSVEKPADDYSIGLPSTELEAELKKRQARAEKFGIVEDTQTALDEAEKALQRAKRFGTSTGNTSVGVKGLDEALPSESPRKRGYGDGQGGRGGKRRNFGGRNRNTRPNYNQNTGRGGNKKAAFNDKDASANEARKKRFATAA